MAASQNLCFCCFLDKFIVFDIFMLLKLDMSLRYTQKLDCFLQSLQDVLKCKVAKVTSDCHAI